MELFFCDNRRLFLKFGGKETFFKQWITDSTLILLKENHYVIDIALAVAV